MLSIFSLLILVLFPQILSVSLPGNIANLSPCPPSDYKDFQPFVVGGSPTYPNQYPWIVNIRVNENEAGTTLCGGSLIGWNVVVSAAHCLFDETGKQFPNNKISVVVADYNITCLDKYEQRKTVEDVRVHPNWQISGNDIALLKLSGSLKNSKVIDIIDLPTKSVSVNSTVIVAGWGATEKNDFSEILLETDIYILNKSQCNLTEGNLDLCAGGNGKDACLGDSGGPMICTDGPKFYVCGIVSYGQDKPCGKNPGVYVNTFGHLQWINDNRDFPKPWTMGVVLIGLTCSIVVIILSILAYKYFKQNSRREHVRLL